MKKFISLLIVFCMTISLSTQVFAMSFSDLPNDHWAISYVNTLVSDGTINGFEDGTFRPAGTVTRAEFVKMIGKGNTRRTSDYMDVDNSHWAYEYIMTSGFETGSEFFEPSKPITRGEVATILWTRAGSPKGLTAPPVIFAQGINYDAVSWVYTYKIMNGDDFIDLRLDDTLTRAEATALIVRSRQINASSEKVTFMDSIDQNLFEIAYNAYGVVDKEYSADATLTMGEVAMAAARILSGSDKPDYPGVSATISFEHPYAQAINMISRYYAGSENDNVAYADKTATVRDAIMALMFATQRTSALPISYDKNGTTYANANPANDAQDALLKKAYQNGIYFTSPEAINLDKTITLKEFACLLIEFDGFSGFNSGYRYSANSRYVDYKLNTVLSTYPSNASDYRMILSTIPAYVYEKPFVDAVELPKDSYKTTSVFDGIFQTMFKQWYTLCKNSGIQIEIYDNPVLAVKTSGGYTFRIKLKIVDKAHATKLSDIINCADETIGAYPLVNGDEIYLDVNTGKKLDDVFFPFENIFVSQII
ncbi:MAG: S-layer homology domain-containing protein [Clostridia bacterium]|nr:S-layer homology domain-containing protein [Clostridia bacterium]